MKLASTVLVSSLTSLLVVWLALTLVARDAGRSGGSSSAVAFAANPQPLSGLVGGRHYVAAAPGADLAPGLNAAIASLSGSKVTRRGPRNGCGTIELPEGTFTLSTTIKITNPCVSIYGQGRRATVIDYIGNGAAFDFTDNRFGLPGGPPGMGGTLADFALKGTSNPGVVGLHVGNVVGLTLEDLEIYEFNGIEGAGIWFDNTEAFTERFFVSNDAISNCTTGLRFTKQPGAQASFEHGHIQVWLSVSKGQTGISLENGADLSRGYLEINGNIAHTGTIVHVDGRSMMVEEFGIITAENTDGKGAIGFRIDPPRGGAALTGLYWKGDGGLIDQPPGRINVAGGNGFGGLVSRAYWTMRPGGALIQIPVPPGVGRPLR